MAANETTPILTTSEVITNVSGPPTIASPAPSHPANPTTAYPPTGPLAARGQTPLGATELGVGIEGEQTVWEANYSMKNFVFRIGARTLLTLAWIALGVMAWRSVDSGGLRLLTWLTGIVVALAWITLIYRIILARFGHHYRLTTRRLFVSTGVWNRRRDMLELLGVRDVYTRQSFSERWLGVGTVIVESSDHSIPTFFVPGIKEPKRVMDLVWHHARAERDLRSVKVEEV